MKKLSIAIFYALISFIACAEIRKSSIAAFSIAKSQNNISHYTAKDYVQNGLICMWDGIENVDWGTHDAIATYWVNLIDGSRDQIIGTFTKHYEWSNDALIRLNEANGKFYSDKTTQLLQAFKECTFTIESVTSTPTISNITWQLQIFNISETTTERYNFGLILRYRRVNDGKTGNVYTGKYSSGADYIITPFDALLTWTCSYSQGYGSFYANGEYASSTIVSPDDSIQGVIIRLGSSSYGFLGHYHCLRIYNRQLTEKEIKHNAEIDKRRFGL